jgi:hypothetical protein
MTNTPDSRKTHVTRICGTNDNDDVLQNMYADMERMEIVKYATQSKDGGWQGHQQKVNWGDDPDSDEGVVEPRTRDGNDVGSGSRDVITCKIFSADEPDYANPSQWIPIDVIKDMRSRSSDHGNSSDQGQQQSFVNDLVNDARKITQRRVYFQETSIDDRAQAAFDADPKRKVFVAQGSDYSFTPDTANKGSYAEVEVITFLKPKASGDTTVGQGDDQGMQISLKNQYLIDQSDPAQLVMTGPDGFNPPFRFDPFQNLVNIKLTTIYLLVEISAGNNSFSYGPYGDAPGIGVPTISSSAISKSAKLLDDQNLGITDITSFIECLVWDTIFGSPEAYWEINFRIAGHIDKTGDTCVISSVDPTIAAAPMNFENGTANSHIYLYRVPAGDDVVEVNISGLVATFNSGGGGLESPRNIKTNGAGTLVCSVYSTIHGNVKKIHQLLGTTGDGIQRPTPDDTCFLNVLDGEHQGAFKVNVKLETDKSKVQTDNYGNKFQPYKVTLNKSSTDNIPSQPPPRLIGPLQP